MNSLSDPILNALGYPIFFNCRQEVDLNFKFIQRIINGRYYDVPTIQPYFPVL